MKHVRSSQIYKYNYQESSSQVSLANKLFIVDITVCHSTAAAFRIDLIMVKGKSKKPTYVTQLKDSSCYYLNPKSILYLYLESYKLLSYKRGYYF